MPCASLCVTYVAERTRKSGLFSYALGTAQTGSDKKKHWSNYSLNNEITFSLAVLSKGD